MTSLGTSPSSFPCRWLWMSTWNRRVHNLSHLADSMRVLIVISCDFTLFVRVFLHPFKPFVSGCVLLPVRAHVRMPESCPRSVNLSLLRFVRAILARLNWLQLEMSISIPVRIATSEGFSCFQLSSSLYS